MLEWRIPEPKANKVPPVNLSPSRNKTPNLEATAPGERGERPDGGLGRGCVRPGRGAGVRTRVQVSEDSQGGRAHLGGACGGSNTGTQGQRWVDASGVLGADPAPANRQVRGGPRGLGCALCLERGRRGRDVGREEGRGALSTLLCTQATVSCSHSHSQSSRRPCGLLPHALARIFCFVVSFRSINKCVIVNVKTHQSNNNGTKSKDYPSLLVTAE